MNLQDFVNGEDFTLYVTQTAAMHNLLVSAGTPFTDKGLAMFSNDTALNTPDVPNPLASVPYNKWKQYIWVRRPHSTDTNTVPWIYLWNDNATNDPVTYLKWQRSTVDTSLLQADIDALEAQMLVVQSDIAEVLVVANAANANSSLALSTANDASNTATIASNNAAIAQSASEEALTLATTAQSTAANAAIVATAANTSAAATAATVAALTPRLTLTTKGPFPIVAGTVAKVAHGYATAPVFVRWVLECITLDGDFIVGTEIAAPSVKAVSGIPEEATHAFTDGADDTNVFLYFVGLPMYLYDEIGGNYLITNARWQAKCYIMTF